MVPAKVVSEELLIVRFLDPSVTAELETPVRFAMEVEDVVMLLRSKTP